MLNKYTELTDAEINKIIHDGYQFVYKNQNRKWEKMNNPNFIRNVKVARCLNKEDIIRFKKYHIDQKKSTTPMDDTWLMIYKGEI